MKKIFALCGLVLIGGVVAFAWNRSMPQHYGEAFKGLPEVAIADLLENGEKHLDKDIRITGTITKQ